MKAAVVLLACGCFALSASLVFAIGDRDKALRERDEALKLAAAWKQKDEANYPLVRQWRTAYEALVAKGCK